MSKHNINRYNELTVKVFSLYILPGFKGAVSGAEGVIRDPQGLLPANLKLSGSEEALLKHVPLTREVLALSLIMILDLL